MTDDGPSNPPGITLSSTLPKQEDFAYRSLGVLSDIEFEELVADLLSAEFDTAVERFARGRDGGIDLRWNLPVELQGIGQCKHYTKSTFAQLLSAAKGEIPHLTELRPSEYRFVTSFDLSASQKSQIADVLRPWIRKHSDVLGARDVRNLIDRHPKVERKHVKLWLATGTQLFWATNAGIANRSVALRNRIETGMSRYVTSDAFSAASSTLAEHKVCVIAGPPGIGKTTLAHALVASAIKDGLSPIDVSTDIDEAWTAFDQSSGQVFLYDDFLGELSFGDRLAKNEDKRLTDFIERVHGSDSKRFVLTTREYVLQDAKRSYDRLARMDDSLKFVIDLPSYSREDKARILYNHLWFGDLSPMCLTEIANGGYKAIVDHPNFSPRLVEYCTNSSFDCDSPGYPGRVLGALDHPDQLWKVAFDSHFSDTQRNLTIALATLPTVNLGDLERATQILCQELAVPTSGLKFRQALETLEGTFIRMERLGDETAVEFHNPSIRQFVLGQLSLDAQLLRAIVRSSIWFDHVYSICRYAGLVGTFRTNKKPLLDVDSADFPVIAERLVGLQGSQSLNRSRFVSSQANGDYLVTSWPRRPGSLASRLEDLTRLSTRARPTPTTLEACLAGIQSNWESLEGDKRESVDAMIAFRQLDPSLSDKAIRTASSALESYLAFELEDVTDDWLPYLSWLEHTGEIGRRTLASTISKFRDCAVTDLKSCDEEHPDLDELDEWADKLDLPSLSTEVSKQITRRELEDLREQAERDRSHTPTATLDEVLATGRSEVDLKQLFDRLARNHD